MSTFSCRETWAEISLDAIGHNVQLFKQYLSKGTRFMAVVKGDGYGHGSVEVGKTAIEAGADYLGVAFLDEALFLRKHGITTPILVLGYTPPASVKLAIENQITLTVYSEDVINEIALCSTRDNTRARVHIKVDTGMGRIGVTTKLEALRLAKKVLDIPSIELEGIFTHFANADHEDPTYTQEQFQMYTETINELQENNIEIPIKHCCNSAGTINFPEFHLDMVRVGISLYGLRPATNVNHPDFPLKQAMHLKTKVSAIRQLVPGQSVSYGSIFTAKKQTHVATIPIGYADGYSRLLSNKGHALIHNKRVSIVGRICMDQTMLDISDVRDIEIGDEVILFGGNNKSFISIDEIAEHMGTISYEVVCLIGKRVPRVFLKEEQVIGHQNALLSENRVIENTGTVPVFL